MKTLCLKISVLVFFLLTLSHCKTHSSHPQTHVVHDFEQPHNLNVPTIYIVGSSAQASNSKGLGLGRGTGGLVKDAVKNRKIKKIEKKEEPNVLKRSREEPVQIFHSEDLKRPRQEVEGMEVLNPEGLPDQVRPEVKDVQLITGERSPDVDPFVVPNREDLFAVKTEPSLDSILLDWEEAARIIFPNSESKSIEELVSNNPKHTVSEVEALDDLHFVVDVTPKNTPNLREINASIRNYCKFIMNDLSIGTPIWIKHLPVGRNSIVAKLSFGFTQIQLLGSGSFGNVYSFKVLNEMGQPVGIFAVKIHHEGSNSKSFLRPNDFYDESSILHDLNTVDIISTEFLGNPHFLQYYGSQKYEGRIISFHELGSSEVPADLTVKDYGNQLFDALNTLHTAGYTHGDIKPGNFVFGADGQLKVIDLGGIRKNDVGTQSDRFSPPEYNQFDHPEGFYKPGVKTRTIMNFKKAGNCDKYPDPLVCHKFNPQQMDLYASMLTLLIRRLGHDIDWHTEKILNINKYLTPTQFYNKFKKNYWDWYVESFLKDGKLTADEADFFKKGLSDYPTLRFQSTSEAQAAWNRLGH